MKPRSKLILTVVVAVLAVAAVFFTISLVITSLATDESVEELRGAGATSQAVVAPIVADPAPVAA